MNNLPADDSGTDFRSKMRPVEITVPIMGVIPRDGLRIRDYDLPYVNKNVAGQEAMGLFTGVYATNSREQLYYACVRHMESEAGHSLRMGAMTEPVNLWMLDVSFDVDNKQSFFRNLKFEDALDTGTVRMDRILSHSAKDVIATIRAWMIRTYGGVRVAQVDFSNLSALTTNYPQFIPWFFETYPQMNVMIHSAYLSFYKKPFTVMTIRQVDGVKMQGAMVRSMPHIKLDLSV